MKKILLLLPLALALPGAAPAQSAADSAAIRRAALDYFEAWYAGDGAQMARAVHPQLAKRIVRPDPRTGRSAVHEMSADQLVSGAHGGAGLDTPPEKQRKDVRILDVYENTASVRADADGWIDYMHLARVDGQWRILNVLWEMRPGHAQQPARRARPSGGER
ncbi:MAG TPA: nuclear transport factor 2 family protein [Longimicrobiaceae bacterium]|nr:nuclear transport factor 2 family protein [Longimicrobiaceae bacterium]